MTGASSTTQTRAASSYLTLSRINPGDSRRTLVATHYVSPRRACPAPRGGYSIARRARLKKYNSGSSGAHPVQGTLMLLPTGTIYRGTHRNIIQLVRCKVPTGLFSHDGEETAMCVGCSSPAGDGPFIPGLKARGFLALFCNGHLCAG